MSIPVDVDDLSRSISELSEDVVYVEQTTANFSELTELKLTLKRIKPIVDEMKMRNLKLDGTEQQYDMLIYEIQRARDYVLRCSEIKWNFYNKKALLPKLKDVNDKLLRFFPIEVQPDQSPDIKRKQVEVTHVSETMTRLALDVSTSSKREHVGSEIIEREKLGWRWRVPRLPRRIVAFEKQLAILKDKVLINIDDDENSMDCDGGFDDGLVTVISAAGGCGKTTLATMLCYDPEIQAVFGKNIFFVTVSKTPNFMVIVNDFLNPNSFGQQVPFQSDEDAKNMLEKFLCEKVSGPMLLVLDNVWSDSFIEKFAFKIRGYKILVTSTIVFPKYDVLQFDPLSNEEVKTLFHFSAFPKDRRPAPTFDKDLVNQMVKCCKKHPLTLSVVGSSLAGKDETVWRYMLKAFSQAHSVLDLNEEILNRLERIFEALDDKVKECYLDFGLFPEDQRIPASALLNMWMHLYDHDDKGSDTLVKILQLFDINLVNLLCAGNDPSAIVNYCEQKFVTQHYLLRQLAINLNNKLPEAQRKRLIISAQGEDLPASIQQVQEPMQAHILSISTGESFSSRWCNMEVPNVEVLVLNLMSKTYTLPHFLKEMQNLKILNITNYGLYPTEFENFHLFGCLTNLTRIRLERVSVSSLSRSILALENLQTMSFVMCKIGDAFGILNSDNKYSNVWPSLVEIEMDYCQDLVAFPGIMCRSIHLKKLSITNCNQMYELSEEFGKLTSLETLSVRSCTKLEKLPESLTRLQMLSILDISDCFSLSKLPEQIGTLGGLRTINMKGCTGVHELPISVKKLSHTQVVCNEEISYQWQEFPNVKIIMVKEDILETQCTKSTYQDGSSMDCSFDDNDRIYKPQEMAMLVDPLISESISQLLDAVMYVAQTTANFKSQLTQLKLTLERIKPIFDEIEKLNQILDRPKQQSDMFIEEIQDASELVLKCSKIKRNLFKKFNHSLKLKDVNQKLLKFFQIEVQADQSRDIKRMLVEVNHVSDRLEKIDLDVKYLVQTVSSGSMSMSMSWSGERVGRKMIEREQLGWRVPALPRGIVAFDEPLKNLKAKVVADIDDNGSLMDWDGGFDDGSVVVISAPGGCGKTTLVTMLCHDPEIQDIFRGNVFFVTVSETPNLMVIVNDLLNPNSYGQQVPFQSNEDAKNKLENFLREKVSHPILLVLDDVRSVSFIKNFAFKIKGYKILVTSRMVFPNYEGFQFDPLSDEDAKKLFQQSAFPQGRRPRLTIDENLVNQMVKCCKKHPLTLSVVGSSLDGKDETVWRYMLKTLSQGQSVLDLNQEILNGLERSFEALNERFKQCYLDFGLFPEDQRIPASALLNMWVHLYDHDDEGNDTLAQIFELSYRNLVSLMNTGLRKDSSAQVNYCEQQFVTQHDLLRQLAINFSSKPAIARRKRLIISAQGEDLPASVKRVQEPMEARILSISTGESFSSRWCNMKVPEVEVMVLNLMSKTYALPHFLEEMQKLKVLNVTNYGLYPTEFENFHLLGCLSNLTRIRLERVAISSLSASTLGLVNLQKVSFIMCKIGNAFEGLTSDNPNVWPRLLEIEMDYCQDLVVFPEILCGSIHLKKLSITNCNEMCELSEEFGKLTSLETLSLRSCTKLEKLPESLTRLQKLSILDISDCLSLSELPEQIGKLGGLQMINMKGCTGVHELPTSAIELSHTLVICNEEISYQWQEFPNVEVNVVEEDRLETLMRII